MIEDAQFNSQRYHNKLIAPPDATPPVNLLALLRADSHDAVGGHSGQQSFDAEKQAGLVPAVITVKDMTVVGMHKPATPRPSNQGGGRQPAIGQAGNASDRSRFSRMCMHN